MPKFFNTSRGPASFVTASGQVAAVGPKKWLEIPAHESGSNSLIQLLQRGILVRAASEPAVEAAPAPVAAPVESAAPVTLAQTVKEPDALAQTQYRLKTRAQRRAEAAAKQFPSDDKTPQDE